MLSICKALFDEWNKSIRYCHWKSNEHLEDGLDGITDLDVFVLPEDKTKCEDLLRKLNLVKFKPQPSSTYPMVDEWIGFDCETGALIHLHLHYRIITGTKFCKEYAFPIENLIIETRIKDNDTEVYVASPEVELIVLYSRIVLKSKDYRAFDKKDFKKEVVFLKQKANEDVLLSHCKNLVGEKGGAVLFDLIKKESVSKKDYTQIKSIVKKWLSKYKNRSSFGCWLRTKYYWCVYFYGKFSDRYSNSCRIYKKTLPNSGLSICFLGQDGSGKSTLSKDISKWLNWKIANHKFYLGSGELYRSPLKSLLSILGRKSSKSVNNSSPRASSVSPSTGQSHKKMGFKHSIGALLSSFNLCGVASSALKKVRKSVVYTKKGGIAIFDRFPQNQFPGIYDGPKIRALYSNVRFFKGFVLYLAKKEESKINHIQKYQPDMVFKLVLSPEESMRRKPFENFESVKIKSEITRKLSFPNSHVEEIDATMDYKLELLQVKHIIWGQILKLL